MILSADPVVALSLASKQGRQLYSIEFHKPEFLMFLPGSHARRVPAKNAVPAGRVN
jgi:hypothetical protein